MIEQKEHFHGSDLEKIETAFGIPKDEIVQFSSNVNPLGISYRLRESLAAHLDVISNYPDREYTDLRKSIANYVNSNPEHIIVGNGTTELISLIIQLKSPKHSIIVSPTYSEYEHEILLSGGCCSYYQLQEDNDFTFELSKFEMMMQDQTELLVLCNPNNPTASLLNLECLSSILTLCKKHKIFVMIDETYIEFVTNYEDASAIPLTNEFDNLIILRGISKFFAAPGLRLGYAICSDPVLFKEIDTNKKPWTINSLAAVAGEIMFSDEDYINKTRSFIQKEREQMKASLEASGKYKVGVNDENGAQ